MNSVEREMREELAKRLRLFDEGEVIIFSQISKSGLEVARASGALRCIICFDDRRFYEEVEVLGWLKNREA